MKHKGLPSPQWQVKWSVCLCLYVCVWMMVDLMVTAVVLGAEENLLVAKDLSRHVEQHLEMVAEASAGVAFCGRRRRCTRLRGPMRGRFRQGGRRRRLREFRAGKEGAQSSGSGSCRWWRQRRHGQHDPLRTPLFGRTGAAATVASCRIDKVHCRKSGSAKDLALSLLVLVVHSPMLTLGTHHAISQQWRGGGHSTRPLSTITLAVTTTRTSAFLNHFGHSLVRHEIFKKILKIKF